MKNTYERDGKTYEKTLVTTIGIDKYGKLCASSEWVETEVNPVWNDEYRNNLPINPTEKAPSFKSKW